MSKEQSKKRKPKWHPLEDHNDNDTEVNRYRKRIKRLEVNVTTLGQALLALEDRLELLESGVQFLDNEKSTDGSIELNSDSDSESDVKIIINKRPQIEERNSPGVSINTDSSREEEEEEDSESTGKDTSEEEEEEDYKKGKASWYHGDIMGNVRDYRSEHFIEDSNKLIDMGLDLDNHFSEFKKTTPTTSSSKLIILLEDDDESQ